MNALVDMTGQVVDGIRVLDRHDNKGGKPAWKCVCLCGATFVASGCSLRAGRVHGCPSCVATSRVVSATKHGGVKRPEYITWFAMKDRCKNKRNKRYQRYGGRGIKVCDRWGKSFSAFFEDMGEKPSPEHTIERIDINGNYEPGNCVWASRTEQANNRSNNHLIDIDGNIKTLTQWSREAGVHRTVITRRMKRGLSGIDLIKKDHRHE